jgi:ketosteroid isomerase-like protein
LFGILKDMQTNAQLLLAGYDAWNCDDCDAWLALLDPEIEIHTSGVFPDLSPEYRGHRRARKFWHQLRAPWETFSIEVERMEEEGDYAAAAIRFRARGIDSGVEVDMRFGNAVRVRDGLAVELVNRRTFEEVRAAMREKQSTPRGAAQPTT